MSFNVVIVDAFVRRGAGAVAGTGAASCPKSVIIS